MSRGAECVAGQSWGFAEFEGLGLEMLVGYEVLFGGRLMHRRRWLMYTT